MLKQTSEMDFNELMNYWSGRMIIGIGEGNLRSVVAALLQVTMSDSYSRGFAEGKQDGKTKKRKTRTT